MKKRILPAVLAVSLLLSGCGLFEGSYMSVTPHQEQRQTAHLAAVSAKDYLGLMDALTKMIAAGTETATINVSEYPANAVESGMAVAMRYALENDPIGAYAVDKIEYALGFSGGQPAVAVEITYLHTRAEIRRIQTIEHMEEADILVTRALENYDAGLVMLVQNYRAKDFTLLAEAFAEEKPQLVMEIPQVSTIVYGTGRQRVVELNFIYQTARDALRQMQSQVKPVFEAAALYISEDSSQWQKFSQLYGFLMERFDYTVETSITPAYSLLHHGVGDSRAFATVYAALCRQVGLECSIVTGTRSGEPWTWNIIEDNGLYYHVDLLRSNGKGRFQELTDYQMQGYVWDYSAYPACKGPEQAAQEPEEVIPVQDPEEQTEPAQTAEPESGTEEVPVTQPEAQEK